MPNEMCFSALNIGDACNVIFCSVYFLQYEMAPPVIAFEVMKYHRYSSFAWFYFEFSVAVFVCCTSVFTNEMTMIL